MSNNDHLVPPRRIPPASNLERQVEHGAMRTHSLLGQFAERINRVESFLYVLADALIEGKLVDEQRLHELTIRAKKEIQAAGDVLHGGATLRIENENPPAPVAVDCTSRLPICGAACCKLSFALSVQEVEAGILKWDLGWPYHIRQGAGGFCAHLSQETLKCSAYAVRPGVCEAYSCADDARIWTDFDNMVLNKEWIDSNLGERRPRLAMARMAQMKPARKTTPGDPSGEGR
jgi:hypothetical protein